MGVQAIKILRKIKEAGSFLIINGENAAMMADIIEIDRFHIGRARHSMTAKIMGIPKGSGFIQFVPVGVRTTLAYPTPVQTSKDFDTALKGKVFRELKRKIGEEKLMKIISKDAIEKGTPIKNLLGQLTQAAKGSKSIEKVEGILCSRSLRRWFALERSPGRGRHQKTILEICPPISLLRILRMFPNSLRSIKGRRRIIIRLNWHGTAVIF